MPTVVDHYEKHRGPVYTWMSGGIDAALEQGAKELESLGLSGPQAGTAVDLGAGFGMHAIPLARLGFSVIAIDSCRELLDTLAGHERDSRIKVIEADLL